MLTCPRFHPLIPTSPVSRSRVSIPANLSPKPRLPLWKPPLCRSSTSFTTPMALISGQTLFLLVPFPVSTTKLLRISRPTMSLSVTTSAVDVSSSAPTRESLGPTLTTATTGQAPKRASGSPAANSTLPCTFAAAAGCAKTTTGPLVGPGFPLASPLPSQPCRRTNSFCCGWMTMATRNDTPRNPLANQQRLQPLLPPLLPPMLLLKKSEVPRNPSSKNPLPNLSPVPPNPRFIPVRLPITTTRSADAAIRIATTDLPTRISTRKFSKSSRTVLLIVCTRSKMLALDTATKIADFCIQEEAQENWRFGIHSM
mmetsp:Transcript_15921/g.32893  ORF Transcript_15921/g.32893 Transcript_15921/m.32893 type:complete len:312 (-) Transcript_15921:102-1037(-)